MHTSHTSSTAHGNLSQLHNSKPMGGISKYCLHSI